ncbi:uncharacterized protein RBU33_003566 isoform 1-T1 [Hipposideros larvatus]
MTVIYRSATYAFGPPGLKFPHQNSPLDLRVAPALDETPSARDTTLQRAASRAQMTAPGAQPWERRAYSDLHSGVIPKTHRRQQQKMTFPGDLHMVLFPRCTGDGSRERFPAHPTYSENHCIETED